MKLVNLGGMTSTLADSMTAEKRDQSKIVDIDEVPPRKRHEQD
jgi:hypothetical protein